MATLVLEVNDAGILALRDRVAKPVLESPGLALLDGDTLLTGKAAERRARLKPRFRHSRFWEALDRAPLSKPFPTKLTHADLVHAHLSDVWREVKPSIRQVVLLVPGFYSDDQIALLLGIARAVGVPVGALVDTAIACGDGDGESDGNGNTYLDIFLHRASRTRPGRRDVHVDDEVGLVTLRDAWVKLLARGFVRQTRFDPLHRAETEQHLYDELPGLLQTLLSHDATQFVFQASGKEYRIDVSREEWVHAVRPLYERIVALAEGSSRATLSHRLADLPGLVAAFPSDVAVAPPGWGPSAVLDHLDRLPLPDEGGALPFVTRFSTAGPELPAAAERDPQHEPDKPRAKSIATHVVLNGIAHAIDPAPFYIGLQIPAGARGLAVGTGEDNGVSPHHCSLRRVGEDLFVEDHSREGCFVNDFRVDEMAHVRPGDRLRLGASDVEVQLIEVKS